MDNGENLRAQETDGNALSASLKGLSLSSTDEVSEVSEPKKLTPYQGKRRSFGFFRCSKCNVVWTSANSWANTYQNCKTCGSAVYPYRMFKLLPGTGSGERKGHRMDLCQRCKEIGRRC